MNKPILLFFTTLAIAFSTKAQTTDTVSTGASYANQVWYSLENDEQATVSGTAWDFGFQINGFSASILANTAYGAELYIYPNGDTGSWSTLDTNGISNWTAWHNPSTTWNQGAFNMGVDTSDSFDLGWGKYNMITHHITGDSLFVWKTANGTIYKVWLQNLASGTYNFLVADYSGNNIDTVALSKSNFSGKNFGYYSIANDSILDIEPLSNNWDLVFSKYMEEVDGMPYPVSGIQTNIGIEAVKVYPVDDVNTYDYDSAQTQLYSSEINVIGHDWKEFVFSNMSYEIEDSTVYFIKKDTIYWKLVMKGFGGSANGNYIFEKTKLNAVTGLFEKPNKNNGSFKIYPNPATNGNIHIETDLPKSVKSANVNIYNINGQLVESKRVEVNNQKEGILYSLDSHKSGIFFIQINHELGSLTQRLIIQ